MLAVNEDGSGKAVAGIIAETHWHQPTVCMVTTLVTKLHPVLVFTAKSFSQSF